MSVQTESNRTSRRQSRRLLPFQLPQLSRKTAPETVEDGYDFDDQKTTTSTSSSNSGDPVAFLDESEFEDSTWTPPLSECDNWFRTLDIPQEDAIHSLAHHSLQNESSIIHQWESPRSRRRNYNIGRTSKLDDDSSEEKGQSMMIFRDDIAVEEEGQENEHLLSSDTKASYQAPKSRRKSGFSLMFPSRSNKSKAFDGKEIDTEDTTPSEDVGLLGEWTDSNYDRQLAFDVDCFHADDFELEELEDSLWLLRSDDILDLTMPPAQETFIKPEPVSPTSFEVDHSMEVTWMFSATENSESDEDDADSACAVTSPDEDNSIDVSDSRSRKVKRRTRTSRRRKKKPVKRNSSPSRASDFRCELDTVVEESPSDDEEQVSALASSGRFSSTRLSSFLSDYSEDSGENRIEI